MTDHEHNRVAGGGQPQPLAVDARTLGLMLSLSVRTIRKLDSSGKLPRPLKIGGHAVRWVVDEIRDWLAAGSPDRRAWELVRNPEK